MQKPHITIYHLLILVMIVFTRMGAHAAPYPVPTPPHLASKAYVLVDANSGVILAEQNKDKRIPPASLTKMMTMYVISSALERGEIRLDDKVRVSKKAWKMGGSKMFIRAGQQVRVKDLILGIIVDSGNDACVAMAEHLGGNEANFAVIMNQYAKKLGMTNSHFTDSTGLPDTNHYSSAGDLAKLARAIVNDFPEYYAWYKQKWFKFNNIKQPNRNRLLWRDNSVDGIKTGHTKEAGYCLVSSAKKDDMRLVAILLGAPSETAREDSSERLLSHGFRFYKTYLLFKKGQKVTGARVWKGQQKNLNLSLHESAYITIPKGLYDHLKISTELPTAIIAPLKADQQIGHLKVVLDNQTILSQPLYAQEAINKGGLLLRVTDSVKMKLNTWFG